MKNKSQLIQFNQIYKEMDTIYHTYAKSIGLSDTVFWILYCISEQEEALTQRDLCKAWSFAPQTLNSALKEMEKRGLISLDPVLGNRKNKCLRLTADGERLVVEAILPLMRAEGESFSVMSEEECEQMLSLTKRYSDMLRTKIRRMTE